MEKAVAAWSTEEAELVQGFEHKPWGNCPHTVPMEGLSRPVAPGSP